MSCYDPLVRFEEARAVLRERSLGPSRAFAFPQPFPDLTVAHLRPRGCAKIHKPEFELTWAAGGDASTWVGEMVGAIRVRGGDVGACRASPVAGMPHRGKTASARFNHPFAQRSKHA